MLRKTILGLLMIGLLVTFACSDKSENARIIVRLTDSPGDFEEVNVDIRDIQVKADDGEGENGWTSLPGVNAGIYNLLELTNGTETVLTNAEYPTGRISQIRLILGDNNTVKVSGGTFPIATPSAQQSGLKLSLHADLISGITYSILLDFDAARSVVRLGNGGYILKPVIHVVSEAQDGAIAGVIDPSEVKTAIFVISGLDTLRSAYSNQSSGQFFVGGLPSGTYKVTFEPGEDSGFENKVLDDVSVNVGSVNDLGTVNIVEIDSLD
jgi:hypothetical protein